MPNVVDGSKKNFNTTVVGTSVTVIAQYSVRNEYNRQYYSNSRVYEFNNRPVWGENILSFVTPLVITNTPAIRLKVTGTNNYLLLTGTTLDRVKVSTQTSGYSTATKYFITGTNTFRLPINSLSGGVGTINTFTDIQGQPNIYGVALITTATWAFAIEQLPSSQTSGLTVNSIITVNTSSGNTGNFGSGNTAYVREINTNQIIVIATSGTTAPVNGTIDGITNTGQTFFVPPAQPLVAQYLIVGGGGGGGSDMGGGGGAGGYIAGSMTLTTGIYSITVGAGGAGAPAGTSGPAGSNGLSTIAFGFTALGGGGGASKHDAASYPAGSGGSGGGGSGGRQSSGSYGGSPGTGTAGQGNNGAGSGVTWYPGGGGGAGAAASQTGSEISHGGIGILNTILGSSYYWAGGGGGAGYSNYGGNGGLGGGGGGAPRGGSTGLGGGSALNSGVNATAGGLNSQTNVPGGDAGANTGGGGGGGSHYNSNNKGGNGGSGIVVVRYPGSQRATGGTVTTVGGDTVHAFTATGISLLTVGSGSALPTFRDPIPVGWQFTITNLASTIGYNIGDIISYVPRTGTLGSTSSLVYLTGINTASNSISGISFGTTAPKLGNINAVYSTGQSLKDVVVSNVSTATPYTFLVTGLKSTSGLIAGNPGSVITATNVTGSFGAGNTVIVQAILGYTSLLAYVTSGTSVPIPGIITNFTATGALVTLPAIGQVAYTTTGTYSWTAPSGVTSVSVVAVGGGGGGGYTWSSGGGGGGGLGWKNNISVTPGQTYTVVVGQGGLPSPNATNAGAAGGTSYFISTATVAGYGGGQGGPNSTSFGGGYGGGYLGDSGGRGGNAAFQGSWNIGGGGAGGYSGNGADNGGGYFTAYNAPAGSGAGAASGYYSSTYGVPAGGGVGILGRGADGVGSASYFGGGGGSGGEAGRGGEGSGQSGGSIINGGAFGGGGGGSGTSYGGGWGGRGAVRIIWGANRSFPVTQTADLGSEAILPTITTTFKNENVGGSSFVYPSSKINSIPLVLQQNVVPTITSSLVADRRRLTLQRQQIVKTGSEFSLRNNNTPIEVSSVVPGQIFSTGTVQYILPLTIEPGGVGFIGTVTQLPSKPNIYGVAVANGTSWAFAIENLSSTQTSSLSYGSVVTANTTSNSTGNFGTNNTTWVYSIGTGFVVFIASGGATPPVNGTIDRITITGQTYIPPILTNVDLLVVGGGGSGANHNTTNANGGGGAGGLLYGSNISISTGTYAVVIGQGGAAVGNSTNANGNKGTSSTFGTTFIAHGGGGGVGSGVAYNAVVNNGGSGGGFAQANGGGGGPGLSTQINYGGATGYGNAGGGNAQGWTGAGGGGAGSAGVGGSGGVAPAGDGGQGRAYDISGTWRWYAGGGGGGGNSSERAGDGYAGGGRGAGTTLRYNYNVYTAEVNSITTGSGTPNAIPNTGGGGGGGSYWSANGGWGSGSGAGGSGIAIVRYLGGQTSLGGTISSANGYTIHTFTADGTFVFNGTSGLSIPSFRAPVQSPWTFAITGTSVVGFTTGSVLTALPRAGSFGSNNQVYVTSVDTVTNSINCFAWARGPYSSPPTSGLINSIYPTGELAIDTPIVSGIASAGPSAWTFTISNIRGTSLYSTALIFTATSITGSLGTGSTVAVTSVDSFTQIKAYAVGGTTPVAGYIGNPVLSQSTATLPQSGDIAYVTTGTYSWTAPAGVTSVSVVAVGGGGGGGYQWSSGGGGGGGLGWKNNISVTPGTSYTVVVGQGGPSTANATNVGAAGGTSYFISTSVVAGYGGGQGGPNSTNSGGGYGGGYVGDGGGRGGDGAYEGSWTRAGAGAGGYLGRGGEGAVAGGTSPASGSGGGAGGGHYSSTYGVPAGGGVGIYGLGADGVPRGQYLGAGGGSGGANGRGGEGSGESGYQTINGGQFGGGGGGSGTSYGGGWGGVGAVRIIWGSGRAFPATNAGTVTSVAVVTATVDPTRNDNIGGEPTVRDSLLGISIPKPKIQNTVPTQVLVTVGSSVRPSVKTLVHVPTDITNSTDYEMAPSVTTVINNNTSSTYVYRSTAITSSTWIFRIYNISSATVSSLTTSTIITANTSSGQSGSFGVGSTVTVYSIVSATSIIAIAYGGSSAPTQGPINSISAPGGTYVPIVTNYTVHIFTTVGNQTFTPAFTGPVEYLVVAGGGGGADTGGGGAGGYRSSVVGESSGGGAAAESMLNVTAGTPYTVTVGGGGSGQTNNSATPGANGGNSVFGSITALGGGGGGAGFANSSASNGATGGSGGGGSTRATTNIQRVGGSGTTGQGYAGGNSETNNWTGGGGGGAGGTGGNASGNNSPDSANTAGNGGVGVRSSISGAATYYAGGGGGGGGNISAGLGGLGGGGNGEAYGSRAPVSGTANTGGGGGGGWENATQGNGGSGIVIVRYSGSQNATGGNSIYTYTPGSSGPTNQYQVAFNGTSQYLTTPSTANYNLSSGDWTVECWVYVTSNGNNIILTSGTGGSSTWNYWQINSDRSLSWLTNPAGNWNWTNTYASAAGVITLNTWTHIAAVRYGSNFSMYVNGVSVYSTNSFSGAGQGGTLFIGTYYANYNNDGSYFRGNISNFRIVKGTAVYTGAFTTPTAALTAIANTVLLICRSATQIDLSTNAVTITPVNAPTISAGTLVLTDIGGNSVTPTPVENLYLGKQTAFVAVVPVSSSTSNYYKGRPAITSRIQSTFALPNNRGTIKNITPSPVSGSSATIYSTTPLTTTTWAFGIYNLSTATVSSLTYGTIFTIGQDQGNAGTGNTVYFHTATNNTSIIAVATGGSVGPTNGYISGITIAGGTFTPSTPTPSPTSIEYFVVGGGGGAVAGGGGAGGVTTGTSSITAEYRYVVQAGAGGASGQQGVGSAFEQVTVLGGGFGGGTYYGGTAYSNAGGGGASGGGGGSPGSPSYQFQQGGASGGAGTVGQGNNGGGGGWWAGSNTSGGGGGGFTGAGASGSGVDQNGAGYGGAGGSGTTSTFSGSSVTYARGGGGWGAYGAGTPSTAGTPGTGNGGGNYNAGGTGIVMIRYPSSNAPAWSVTGNPTVNVTGGYRIYSWTNTTTNLTTYGSIQFAGPSGYVVPSLGVPGAPGPWTFSLTDMNSTAEYRVGSVINAVPQVGGFGSGNTVRVLSITSSTEMVCVARSGDIAPSLGTVAYLQPTGALEFGPVISNVASAGAGTWTFVVSNLTSTIMMQVGSVIVATTASGSLASFGTGTTAYISAIANISQITAIAMGGTAPVAGVISNVSTSGAVIVVGTGTFQTLNFVTPNGNLTVTNNNTTDVTIFKTSGSSLWDNEARVAQAFTAPCTLEFFKQAASGDNGASYAMIGWNDDPTTNASYNTLDHAAYAYRYDNYNVHDNGTDLGFQGGSWDPAKKFYIVYSTDGYIRHYNDTKLLYSVYYGTGKTVYVDSSFYSVNGTFGGFSNIRVKNAAWTGATGYGLGSADYSIVRTTPVLGRQDNWDNVVATSIVNTLNRPIDYFGNETTEPKVVFVDINTSTARLLNANIPAFDPGFDSGRIADVTTVSTGLWLINIDRMASTRAFTTGTIVIAFSGSGSFGRSTSTVTVAAINSSTSLLCTVEGAVAPTTGTIFAVVPSGGLIISPQITAVNPYTYNYTRTSANQDTYRTSFNGVNDYYSLSANAFAFATNNFTVEAWVWLKALPTSDAWPTNYSLHMMIATVGTPSAGDGIGFMVGQTKLIIHNNDTQYASPSVHGLTTSTWNHVAYVRSGDTFNFYVNGISKGSVGFSGTVGTGSSGWLGCETSQGAFFNGFISNLRMVNGVAGYTGSFTPAGVLGRTQGNGTNISAINANQTTLLAFASISDTDLSINNYTLNKAGTSTISSAVISGSTATSTPIAWTFNLSNLPTTSTARLVSGSVITANTGSRSTGNFGLNNTVYVSTITNGTQITCIAVGGTTAPGVGSIDSISTSGAVVTTTNVLLASEVSGGSFIVRNNSYVEMSAYSSVLFPINQSGGKVYLEFTPEVGSGLGWYVGIQRTPGRVGAYEAGVGATGNLGTGTVFYPINNVISSALINLDTTATVSWNNGSAVNIPGSGQLYFGVYNGSVSTTGQGTINWGTSSFATVIQPVPLANVSATGTSLGLVTYSVTGGSLPAGAYLDSSNGIIYWYRQNTTGISTTTNISVTASAADSGETITRTFSLVIKSPFAGYAFTIATFGAGTQTGNTGPSLAVAQAGMTSTGDISWRTNTANFDVVNGIQIWTVPRDGTYRITAAGARGGQSTNWGPWGGTGASMRGDFALVGGDKIKILVGQQGDSNYYDAGGGGGSFVTTFDNSPLIIAGGGGGGAPSGFSGSGGKNGLTTTSGASTSGAGGTNGGGGGQWSTAGGGGGLTGNGGNAAGSWGGYSFTNGGQGGSAQARGGFGGGGSGGGTNGAGGGGGYSGGAGSAWSYDGGGGGSYNIGTNQSNTAGGGPAGNGFVTIERL